MFAVVFIVFDITEKMLIGVFHGKALAQSIETPGGDGILGVILVAIIITISLVPFFAFVELSRLMDPGELSRILQPVDPEQLIQLHDPINRLRLVPKRKSAGHEHIDSMAARPRPQSA